jgi:hypothetical protein
MDFGESLIETWNLCKYERRIEVDYKIKEMGNLIFFDKNSDKQLFESKVLIDNKEQEVKIVDSHPDLIPIRLDLTKDFSIKAFITKDTYREILEFAEKTNLK